MPLNIFFYFCPWLFVPLCNGWFMATMCSICLAYCNIDIEEEGRSGVI